jgi:hypothetical protein
MQKGRIGSRGGGRILELGRPGVVSWLGREKTSSRCTIAWNRPTSKAAIFDLLCHKSRGMSG